jgi:hypothetical protein
MLIRETEVVAAVEHRRERLRLERRSRRERERPHGAKTGQRARGDDPTARHTQQHRTMARFSAT